MTAFFVHRQNRMIAIRPLNRRKAAAIRCRLRSPGSDPALAVAPVANVTSPGEAGYRLDRDEPRPTVDGNFRLVHSVEAIAGGDRVAPDHEILKVPPAMIAARVVS